MDSKVHWDSVYTTRAETEVSWYQGDPQLSMDLIRSISLNEDRVIDVGGGASVLVDKLLDAGYKSVTVLDISAAGLECTKARLGPAADTVNWIVADITTLDELGIYDVWHDRAVFHFLTDAADREKYVTLARNSLRPGGHVVIGTFGPNGPTRCSGLDVCRYDADTLSGEFAPGFELIRSTVDLHITPGGKTQEFVFCVLQRM